jgi:hypothetical protein
VGFDVTAVGARGYRRDQADVVAAKHRSSPLSAGWIPGVQQALQFAAARDFDWLCLYSRAQSGRKILSLDSTGIEAMSNTDFTAEKSVEGAALGAAVALEWASVKPSE